MPCPQAVARRPTFLLVIGTAALMTLGACTPSPSTANRDGSHEGGHLGSGGGGPVGSGGGNGTGGNGTGGFSAAGGTNVSGTGGASSTATGGATATGSGGVAGQAGTGGSGQDAGAAVDGGITDGGSGGTTRDAQSPGDGEAGAGADGASDVRPDAASTDGLVADPLQVDVYLIGGQSNATGQGYIKNLPSGLLPNAKVSLYHSGAPHLSSGSTPNSWIPLRQASESPDRFGPEIGFGNQIQALRPARRIYLIKHAHTGTSLFQDWKPGGGPTDTAGFGPQFQVFVTTVDGGLKALRDQGLHPVIRGMLWQQGEADADAGGATAQNYGANLQAFISRVRQQWNSPDMLFVYGYVYPPPNMGAGRDAVRLAERNVDQDSTNALAVRGAFVVFTDDLSLRASDPGTPLPNDIIHFGSAGQLELGKRMADKVHAHQLF